MDTPPQNNEESPKDWFRKWAWFGIACFAIYFVSKGEFLTAVSGFVIAFISHPNASDFLARVFSSLKPISIFLFWAVLIGGVIYWLFGSIGKIGKYDGLTAEEWFNRYDAAEARYQELHDCVEPLAISNNYEDLNSIYYECF